MKKYTNATVLTVFGFLLPLSILFVTAIILLTVMGGLWSNYINKK